MKNPLTTLSTALAGAFRRKQAPTALTAVGSERGWLRMFNSSNSAGNFQADIKPDSADKLLAFSAVFSCVTLIAADIAKLDIKIMERATGARTWADVTAAAAEAALLRKPNAWQTRSQFLESWLVSKLLHGNAYILKERDASGAVRALYVLDPSRVTPLVAPDGSIYYRLQYDDLSRLPVDMPAVPASEIVHDRMNCLWHPLVGVSPIYACGLSATMGNRIQANSATLFANMSRPSGMLTAPSSISDPVAQRLKTEFESNFGGENLGRLFVAGDDLKYQGFSIAAVDAQLIEQLNWTVVDVARAFGIPAHLLNAGPAPQLNTVQALEQSYYSRTLQRQIEAIEQSLDAGLGTVSTRRFEFDLDGLLRMDTAAQFDALGKAVGGGWMAPDEARERVNLPPVAGGATPYLQVQNYSLSALEKRDQTQAAPGTAGSGTGKSARLAPKMFPEGKGWTVLKACGDTIEHRWFAEKGDAEAWRGEDEPADHFPGLSQEMLRRVVDEQIAFALASMPQPKDGRDGRDAPMPDINAVVAKLLPHVPKPRDGVDGKDAEPVDTDAIVEALAKRIPTPRDGKPGTAGQDGKDGRDGKDALELEILDRIDDTRQYERGTVARHRGGVVRARSLTAPLKDSKGFEEAGWSVILNGVFKDEETAQEGGRIIRRVTQYTDGTQTTSERKTTVLIDRGLHRHRAKYEEGDVVTYAGSLWIAKRSTAASPAGSASWRLAVKRPEQESVNA